MKSILAILAVLAPLVAFTQEKTFEREYSYKASELDSKASCRAIAINQLRTTLLNEIGVYVESESILKTTDVNGVFAQNFAENIATMTAGITKLQILEETWNGEMFWMKAAITIDKQSLEQSLKDLVNDRKKVKELDSLERQLKEATNELNELHKIMAANPASQSSPAIENSNIQKYNSLISKISLSGFLYTPVGSSFVTAVNHRTGFIEIKNQTQFDSFDRTTQDLYVEHINYYNKAWDYYQKHTDYANAYLYFNKAFRFSMFSKVRLKVDDEIIQRKALYAFLSILKIPKADGGDVKNARELVDDKCNPEQKKMAYDELYVWKKDKKAYWGLRK